MPETKFDFLEKWLGERVKSLRGHEMWEANNMEGGYCRGRHNESERILAKLREIREEVR